MKRLVALLVSLALVLGGSVPAAALPPQPSHPSSSRGHATYLEPAGTPWTDWFVRGLLTDGTQVRLADDFYTAANRDYILARNADPAGSADVAEERECQIADQMVGLIQSNEAGDSQTKSDLACVRALFDLYEDWDTRDEQGVSPMDDIVDRLCDIQTLDDLTDWLCSDDFRLSLAWRDDSADARYSSQGLSLFGVSAYNEVDAKGAYAVDLYMPDYRLAAFKTPDDELFVGGEPDYAQLLTYEDACAEVDAAAQLLEHLGFTRKESRATAREAAELEARLSDASRAPHGEDVALSSESLTFVELAEACEGGFPLDQILRAWGYDDASEFVVDDPAWLARLNELYVDKNLDLFVSHALASIALEGATLLDSTSYDILYDADGSRYWSDVVARAVEQTQTDGSDEADYSDMSDAEWDTWDAREACWYVQEVAPTSYAKVYVQNFYDEGVGRKAKAMVDSYVDAFGELLSDED